MNKFELNGIKVPQELSHTVDDSLRTAKRHKRRFTSIATLAAAFALVLTMLNFNAIAATAQKAFSAVFSSGSLLEDSLNEAIKNDFVTQVPDGQIVSKAPDGKFTLNSYFAEENEIGLDFTLETDRLQEDFGPIYIPNEKLEIKQKDGSFLTWESTNSSDNGEYSKRTFPGGMFEFDPAKGEESVYVEGNDYLSHPQVHKLGENKYNISLRFQFEQPIQIGSEINYSFSQINFISMQDESVDALASMQTLSGNWAIRIPDVKSVYTPIEYELVNREQAAQKGFAVEDIIVTPLKTKMLFTVDYSKNKIANPDNIKNVQDPKYVYKLNSMDLGVAMKMEANEEEIHFLSCETLSYENNIAKEAYKLNSIYYKNAQTFRIKVTERSKNQPSDSGTNQGEVFYLEFQRK